MRYALLFLMLAWWSTSMGSASFEGTITMTERRGSTEVKLVYSVKGKMVRIDTYTQANELRGSRIIDTESGVVLALMPSRLLYYQIPIRTENPEEQCTVKKTSEQRTFLGLESDVYETVNTALDRKSVITVVRGNFDFYLPLIKALGRDDSFSCMFTDAQGMIGIFPADVHEYRSDNTLILRRTVTEIKDATLTDDIFDVPPDYSLMER